ncbi:unnamed protein product, partial [Didymodactylos carnosus]
MNEHYQIAQQKLALNASSKLKGWSDIRWDSRWSSINAIMVNYESIIVALEDLIDEDDHRSVDARGESVDYAESQQLITSVIEQLEYDRNEKSFKTMYFNILNFAE